MGLADAPTYAPEKHTMRIFRKRGPKKLLRITHATSGRDRKELDLRFAFADGSILDATVSFEAVATMARMFNQLARGVQLHAEITDAPILARTKNPGQCRRT